MKETFSKGKHKVEIERNPATGIVTREVWTMHGKQDRPDGPAVLLRDAATGTITYEAWYTGGKLHRADGPAFIKRDVVTGAITREEWFKDGKQAVPPEPRQASTGEG